MEESIVSENLIYGRNAVLEALKSEREFDKIYVKKGEREGSITLIIAKAKERKIPVIEAPSNKLDELSQRNVHQGVVAFLSEISYVSVDDIINSALEKGEKPFIVICDGISDPHNLGAVIRSAECSGVHGIVIPKRRSAEVNATVVKSSAGAANLLPIAKVTNISSVIDELKDKGFFIYGAEAGGEDLYKTDLSGSVAVVMGSEGEGISRLVKSKCDFIVSIPMYGTVNSYNVSCAAAIILSKAAQDRHK